MITIRAATRIIVLLFWTMFVLLIYWIGLVPILFSERKRVQYRRFFVKYWGVFTSKIIGMRLHVRGTPPNPPCCLVSNHLSYIDVLVFQAASGSILLSKMEVKSWPFIGLLSKVTGTLFIDRSKRLDVIRVSDDIQNRLTLGESVVFFPEGTSSDGSQVGPFKSSLLNYFAVASYPVHFATIRYSSPSFDVSTKVCWWGDMLFAPHFWSLMKQPSFDCFLTFGEFPVTDPNRKALTTTLRERIVHQVEKRTP